MGKKLKKRIFSVLLTIVMLVGLIPANTFCVFARPIEPEEVVLEVTSWDEFVEAFNYSSYEGARFTIKLMNNLYANAVNTSRNQTAIIGTSIKGSYVTFDFNGHTLSCTDEVSDTDLDYSLSDFIRIRMHPLSSTIGSELRFIDSKGGGGISMTSSRAYDSQLAALHILGDDYYVNSAGITQSTGYVNNKVIFDGGEYKLSAKTKKFGRGTLDRGVYYRGCVIADWVRAEVNDGIFTAESDGVTSLGRDMCARELSAFATCCSTWANPQGVWDGFYGFAVINGGLFMSDGYSVHHFDNYYELNGTMYMNFPIINAGAFKGGLGFTGKTFTYADGCEEFNEKPATDIISADGYVMGVDGDGDIYDNIQDFTLEDLHDVKSCYILSEDVFNMSTSPKIQDESVELERYMGQTETFNINYEVPLWVQRLGLECNPTISVVGENSQITEETDTLEVSYKDFLGKTKVTLSLLIKNMTIPVHFDKEYNINVADIPNNAVIVLQPRSCDVEPGEWAEATVIANNALSYQWYIEFEGYNFALTESFLSQFDNMNIEGYNSPTLRMKFNDGYVGKVKFYCVVTGNDEGTVKTDKVTFTYGSKPTVIGLSGGTYYADEDATFTLFGNYMENITWKVMHKMSGNMSIYSLDEFAELMGIEYSVKHQKFNNKLYRAEVTFSNVPESVNGKYFVGYDLSNDLGKVSFNPDDTVAFTVTEITPEILEVIENQTCNEGGTLTYSFKANNMTSADWTFEKSDEEDIAIAYTIEDMKELFPDTIFTEALDGENATLTIENVSYELGEYLLNARAMGESASTYVGCALINVRDISNLEDAKTGWHEEEGNWYYYDSTGAMIVGWKKINTRWYYFDTAGIMQSSKWISNKYYVKSNGAMATSEFVDGGKYYVDANGIWVNKTQWLQIGGKWYYIKSGTVQKSKWLKLGGKYYYFDATGIMQTSKWIDNKYYVKKDGTMAAAEFVDNGKYYVNENGVWVNKTQWLKLDGNYYYIKSGVVQKSKWVKIGTKFYYFDTSGIMQTSRWIGGKYYVKADGTMAVSEWVDNGKYYVGEDGAWIPNP